MAQTELAYYYTAIAQRATLCHYSLDTAAVIQTTEVELRRLEPQLYFCGYS